VHRVYQTDASRLFTNFYCLQSRRVFGQVRLQSCASIPKRYSSPCRMHPWSVCALERISLCIYTECTRLSKAVGRIRVHHMCFPRATDDLHCWGDLQQIIGGRDRVNGGTWLGITRQGRFAFVTNFREVIICCSGFGSCRALNPSAFINPCPPVAKPCYSAVITGLSNSIQEHFDKVKNAKSRGALPTDFLLSSDTPQQYADGLQLQVLSASGFLCCAFNMAFQFLSSAF
jgi:hypothetical protein